MVVGHLERARRALDEYGCRAQSAARSEQPRRGQRADRETQRFVDPGVLRAEAEPCRGSRRAHRRPPPDRAAKQVVPGPQRIITEDRPRARVHATSQRLQLGRVEPVPRLVQGPWRRFSTVAPAARPCHRPRPSGIGGNPQSRARQTWPRRRPRRRTPPGVKARRRRVVCLLYAPRTL